MDGVLDYSLLFRSVPGLLLVLTPDLRIVEASDAYLHATMREREEIVGRPLFEVFPDDPDDPAATGVHNLRESLERVLRDRAPHAMAVQKYSIRRPASDGGGFEERYWSPLNVPVFACDGDGDGAGECERSFRWIIHRVEDVTAFVKTSYERERRQMLERIVGAQEEERRRLSRDLHDQMAQHLSALVLGVRALRPHCGDDEAHARLDHLEALAERLGREAASTGIRVRLRVGGQVVNGFVGDALEPLRDVPEVLSDRESEVLRQIARGFSNKEVAAQLSISVKTVETYKMRIMEKIGLRGRADIVRYALRRGWLECDV